MSAQAIAAALEALAPPGVLTGCRPISAADVASLHVVEVAAVSRAVPKRQHEFATGRALLRELLGAEVAIPVRPDRRPDLPDGVIGSLAHTATMAVAVLADARDLAAIGVDLEPATALDAAMAAAILRPDEAGLDAHLAFTLKEAVYKAWSALGGRLLDHHDVQLDLDGGAFRGLVDGRHQVTGRWALAAGHWLALVTVDPDQAAASLLAQEVGPPVPLPCTPHEGHGVDRVTTA